MNEEYNYLLLNVNDTAMEYFYGSSWEQEFGLTPNPQKGEKMKINITSTMSNSTHMNVSYNLWDWKERTEGFSPTPATTCNLTYLRDPYNYTEQHILPNVIPLILPDNSGYYYVNCNPNSSIYEIEYEEQSSGADISIDQYKSSDDMTGYAYYSPGGILERVRLYFYNDSTDETTIQRIMGLNG